MSFIGGSLNIVALNLKELGHVVYKAEVTLAILIVHVLNFVLLLKMTKLIPSPLLYIYIYILLSVREGFGILN